ncbi:MAG: zinc-dependent metalloprotease [Candidatus Zixiibacteriota bacterium]
MRVFHRVILLTSLCAVLLTDLALAGRREYTLTGLKKPISAKGSSGLSDSEKPFADVVKNRVAIGGLFTFYLDTTTNSMFMAIKPHQFDKVFLCGTTLSRAEGAFFDNGAMDETFPFYFTRVGKKVMMMEKNLRLRADSSSSLRRAVSSGLSDHLFSSAKVESKPDTSGAILVDASAFFVRDANNVNYFLGQMGQTGLAFDRDNSYLELVKSFPENSEIDVRLHYRTAKPVSAVTMQNPYSLFHTYHYSLSNLPETDYVPRIADDRVGHFQTLYEDYSTLDKETPYVRYINRWNLKKKDPDARISEPVEPIVFWVENTVPKEYRGAVAEGIEFWNPAFEKIGFRSAIIARQMPDTATWDPADVRYNTVRWMVIPGGGYAVGPSRANPFTGQIYDADIRVSSDFIRYMFSNMENFIKPVSFDGMIADDTIGFRKALSQRSIESGSFCTYGSESAMEAAFGLAYLESMGDLANKDSLTKEYVHSYIVELVAHEVGHTLGFRHNFKASTAYALEQLANRDFTRTHSTGGTVMDYTPPNIAGKGKPQGEYYASTPGPYDNWVIEYAYSDFGAETPEEELPKLNEIASRTADLTLAYGTDEDAFGISPKSVDPACNLFDQGNDALKFARHKIGLTRELWTNTIKEFEKPGTRYQKILSVFQTGWRSYIEAAQWAPKYVGGLYVRRSHIGDPSGTDPFEPVAAADQRKAVEFLSENFYAPKAFDLPAELLNKLQQENLQDFTFSAFTTPQVDYPFHQMVLAVQKLSLDKLYHPLTIGRLLNNSSRFKAGQEKYTMFDMFTDVRKSIWSEAATAANVNSFRRQLQLAHLGEVIDIYLSNPAMYPSDARSLAANDLDILENAASRAAAAGGVDDMSRAHYKEVVRQIAAAKKAQRSYSSGIMIMGG